MISFWPLGMGLSSSTQAISYFWSFLHGFHSHKGRGWAKSLYCTQAQTKLHSLLLCEYPWLWLCWGHTESPPPPHTHQSEPGSKSEYQSCSRLCHVHLHL